MATLFRQSIAMLVLLTALTGILYPLTVTGLAQVLFPRQANGSLIVHDGKVLGSRLIGQPFRDPRYFWSRPSATAGGAYNGLASGGSNLGPTNPALRADVARRVAALRAADPGNTAPVPVDLVTASASGLDPDISPAAAAYQAARVAHARGLPSARVQALIDASTRGRQLGALGEPRVNVLELNLRLDGRWLPSH
ncbi:MAG: potassium-transporting ATPase subunit KdpC [Xanthomonadaceae bacterium]|nr:potassium-transporting ATPase subunit KdpC [Xanthomonadaceae bacterium]MDE2177414.1 potassium-transporting ATPase subunit KdpC [Xanthomonadaceae bacterium]MDE2246379.1 potassium-transporting ATPase subunit KdpC [Xanthomonadaceae bacterium]